MILYTCSAILTHQYQARFYVQNMTHLHIPFLPCVPFSVTVFHLQSIVLPFFTYKFSCSFLLVFFHNFLTQVPPPSSSQGFLHPFVKCNDITRFVGACQASCHHCHKFRDRNYVFTLCLASQFIFRVTKVNSFSFTNTHFPVVWMAALMKPLWQYRLHMS